MKAISILQPFADLIVSGQKRYENRGWFSDYTGPLLIHAGGSDRAMGCCEEIRRKGYAIDDRLPFGAVVGIVDMVGCLFLDELAAPDYFAGGPLCFVFANARRFGKPIALKGQLRLFNVADSIVAAAIESATANVASSGQLF